jgi:hypothetical protein
MSLLSLLRILLWLQREERGRRGIVLYIYNIYFGFRCRRERTGRLLLQVTSTVFSESSFLTFFFGGGAVIPFSSLALKKVKALG